MAWPRRFGTVRARKLRLSQVAEAEVAVDDSVKVRRINGRRFLAELAADKSDNAPTWAAFRS